MSCTAIPMMGPDAYGYNWRLKNNPIPVSAQFIHDIADGNLFLYCGDELESQSCARIDRENARCDIYLPLPRPPNWKQGDLLAHEKLHCAGWVHPDPLKDASFDYGHG